MITEKQTQLWDRLLVEIKKVVNEPSYRTWFVNTKLVSIEDGVITVNAMNDLAKNILNQAYYQDIITVLRDLTGDEYTLRLMTDQELEAQAKAPAQEQSYDKHKPDPHLDVISDHELIADYRLNPRYTFENFVIGKGNEYAHAACLAVAESMALNIDSLKTFNPLFIHGGSGLGKTHLMQAIAHFILQSQRDARVKYVSSETFTNDLIDAIMHSRTAQFRALYRTCDILLVDDIQFVSSKEGTQEEFFHTFNELYEANKQIIIASDRPPKEIPKLEERLRTRFEWGIITDISQPDLETRIAILRKKAQMSNQHVPNDVLIYMAENIQSNIRELEGALLNLTAFSALNGRPLTLDMAQDFLTSYIQVDTAPILNGETIQAKVCETYGVRIEDMNGKRRTKSIVKPRQIAMYLCRDMTDMSLPKIGELFGGRDHSTVLHAVDKVTKMMANDPVLKGSINGIKRDLTETY